MSVTNKNTEIRMEDIKEILINKDGIFIKFNGEGHAHIKRDCLKGIYGNWE